MIPVALQLYSVRDNAAADLAGVIRAAAEMGYDGVEFAGFFDQPAAAVRRALDDAGIRCAGSHARYASLDAQALAQTLAYHREIGCRYVIIPWLPEETRATLPALEKTELHLTDLAGRVRDAGMQLGFHAHSSDMLPLGGSGPSVWEVLAERLPPDFLLQYDTANGMQAGADPVAPIIAHPGRSATVHLKEFVAGGPGESGHGKAAIGDGDVPWAQVFAACEAAGTRWYVVEQEGHPTLSPLEAVDLSLRNLRRMLDERPPSRV